MSAVWCQCCAPSPPLPLDVLLVACTLEFYLSSLPQIRQDEHLDLRLPRRKLMFFVFFFSFMGGILGDLSSRFRPRKDSVGV